MPYEIDETHDPNLESWVESANDPATDFPIQNLPLCCQLDGSFAGVGVRLGDHVVSLADCLVEAENHGFNSKFDSVGLTDPFRAATQFWSLTPGQRMMARRAVVAMLNADSPARDDISANSIEEGQVGPYIHPEPFDDEMLKVGDYTDFYASVFHATNVGSMFRPDNPLLPNYKHVPIAYHGRASTVVPSGTDIVRPIGQQAPTEDGGSPGFGPSKLFDYELEVGVVVGRGNELGTHIPIEEAEDHILGLCLLNDWSARDLQKWEYQPLGPFLAKNFATTVSPYIVTMEALAPFRTPAYERPAGDPRPLPYLTSDANTAHGGVDITLEVHIFSKQMRSKGMDPVRISKGTFKDMYWTIAQMLTHHSVNGCAMQPGDLLGSGTVSGKARDSRGCLLELTWDGDSFSDPPVLVPGTQRTPIRLPTGEERKFLADGDEVILKGYCEREGFRRIGFGECRGIVRPARQI